MNRRLGSVFFFALLISAAASFAVYHFVVAQVASAARRPAAPQKLLVAAIKLEAGHLIQEGDLRFIASDAPSPEGAVSDVQKAVGRGVISTIYPNEPIAEGRLAPRGAGAGLAAMIPIGKRAVALKVDEVVGLAGFVVPGMRVDVLVSGGNSTDSRSGVLSRTALQNIEVLSAGQTIQKSGDGKPQDAQVVNLLVTPDQAEVLSLAATEAKVQLVLRNPLDTKEEKTRGTSVAALFGLPESPKPVIVPARVSVARATPPPVPAPSVEVYSGTKRSEQSLER